MTFTWFAFLEVFAREEIMAARDYPEGCADWHSGDMETALQMYLRPGLVDEDKLLTGACSQVQEFAPYDMGRNWFHQYIIAAYWGPPPTPGEQDTMGGRPDRATPEMGRRILDVSARTIGRFVREWKSR